MNDEITRAAGRMIAAAENSATALRRLVEIADDRRLAGVLANVADLLDGAKYEAQQAMSREGDRMLTAAIVKQLAELMPPEAMECRK